MMSMTNRRAETLRCQAALILCWGGWLGALGIIVWSVWGTLPAARYWSLIFILFIGVAISAGTARSRMRLAQTIADVFGAGMKAAAEDRRKLVDRRHP